MATALLLTLGLLVGCTSRNGGPGAAAPTSASVDASAPVPPQFDALPPSTKLRVGALHLGSPLAVPYTEVGKGRPVVVEPTGRRTRLTLPGPFRVDGFARLPNRWFLVLYYGDGEAVGAYRRDGTPTAGGSNCWGFGTQSADGRALLCSDNFGVATLLRGDGTEVSYRGSNSPVGFLDLGDVVLSAFSDSYGDEPVRIGHPDGTYTRAPRLVDATATCERRAWVAATEFGPGLGHGIFEARSGQMIRLAREFEIVRFSPSCRYVVGRSDRDLVIADTLTGAVLMRLTTRLSVFQDTVTFEDAAHVLLDAGQGGVVVRVSMNGEIGLAHGPGRADVLLPPGS